jgi:arylsulfatase A-like enzyme
MKKLTAFIGVCIIIVSGCFRPGSKPDYIFLITLDTTREDHVLLKMENNTLTPNLAALAASGQYFKNAYALIPITLPSHYAIFYSRNPYQLNIYNNGQTSRLRFPSMTETLKNNGYATGAIVSLGSLGKKYGLNKGFDQYIEEYRRPYLWYKSAGDVNKDAFRLIKQMKGNKAFFWIHYSDPHEPYFPPVYKGKFILRLNGKAVFSCLSAERALIKKELEIKPGKNIIAFKTKLPDQFSQDPELTAEGVGYENLSWIIPHKQKHHIEIQYPRKWTHLGENDQEHHFQSPPDRSELKIINHSPAPVSIQLSFIYRLLLPKTVAQRLYQEEIRYMDSGIGDLIHFLKSQSLYDKSTFIIMGDHGEGLGEYRDCIGHIHYLNKIFTKVPLILAGNGIAEKKSPRPNLVSNLNIAPTILDLLDIPKPTSMLGTSLLHPEKSKKLLLETYAPEAYSDAFSLIDYPYQIIFYPGREREQMELIHLENDFAGIQNIMASADTKIKNKLIQSIQDIVPGLLEAKKNKSSLSEEDQEILKSLGYIR